MFFVLVWLARESDEWGEGGGSEKGERGRGIDEQHSRNETVGLVIEPDMMTPYGANHSLLSCVN